MSELQDKLNEFDVFDKLNTFEDILLFLKNIRTMAQVLVVTNTML